MLVNQFHGAPPPQHDPKGQLNNAEARTAFAPTPPLVALFQARCSRYSRNARGLWQADVPHMLREDQAPLLRAQSGVIARNLHLMCHDWLVRHIGGERERQMRIQYSHAAWLKHSLGESHLGARPPFAYCKITSEFSDTLLN